MQRHFDPIEQLIEDAVDLRIQRILDAATDGTETLAEIRALELHICEYVTDTLADAIEHGVRHAHQDGGAL